MTGAASVSVDPLPRDYYLEHWGAMPPPKFATPRDFSSPTLGERQGKFARIWLNQPFMPAQQYIADVAGEVRLNDSGFWVPKYGLVVVTLQRRGGKSHMSFARNGERSFSVPKWKTFYTAQTGQDARDEFLKFYDERLVDTPLGSVVTVKRGKGDEQLGWPNGSVMRPVPPTEEKLHGKDGDSIDIDEGWAFDELEGEALIQAGAPTKLTRANRGPQTFVWSAGGTAASTWLANLVARGRNGDPGICFIEFGIPDDADPEDLDVIAAHHPAFGHTITMDGLRSLRTDFGRDAAGWARAAGNRWTEIIGGAIVAEDWAAMRYKGKVPDSAAIGYGAARAADGSEVAIVAAVQLANGRIVCEFLESIPAYGATDQVLGWATDGPLAVDPNGPSAPLYRALSKKKRRNLMTISGQDTGAAVANLLDSIPTRQIRFKPHPAFDESQQVAGVRNTGDGGKAWARLAAGASIAPLEAAGLAVHALLHGKKPISKGGIITAA